MVGGGGGVLAVAVSSLDVVLAPQPARVTPTITKKATVATFFI
jgi:hypothetical protein